MAYDSNNPYTNADDQTFNKQPIGLPQQQQQSEQSGMVANAGETPEQMKARYTQDYWAPDRNQVLGLPQQSTQPSTPQGGGGQSFPNMGGGWGASNSPAATALQNAFAQGLTGEAAVNAANQAAGLRPPNSISFGQGGYGLPGGQYAAVNPANGQMDLITRSGPEGGGGGRGGGAYVPGQGVPGQGSIFGPQGGNTRTNALEELLMKRAGQDIIPKTTDPVIKAQTDAFRAEQDRGARTYETRAAERGGPQANLEAVNRSMAEQGAQATGSFEGQAMQRELDARRQEVQSALSGAQGMLTAEEQMQLQEELAQLGLAQGAYQYDSGRQDRLAGF